MGIYMLSIFIPSSVLMEPTRTMKTGEEASHLKTFRRQKVDERMVPDLAKQRNSSPKICTEDNFNEKIPEKDLQNPKDTQILEVPFLAVCRDGVMG